MQAARGRGAAAVAAAVRGALRASTSTRTTRLFPRAASPGPPGFLYLDFFFPFSSREDTAVITKVRGAWGGSSLGLLGPPFAGRGRAPEARRAGWPDYPIDFPFLSDRVRALESSWGLQLKSARDECKGEGVE